jgi:hypothetical protein
MSFDKKDKLIYADNGQTERIISNFYTCIITNLLKKGSADERRVLVSEAQCRISFKIDSYRSHFEISILAPRNAEGDKFYTSYLRFDALSSNEYELKIVDNEVYKALCEDKEKVLDSNTCY